MEAYSVPGKLKNRMKYYFHSISTKVLLIILILVLPLNITAIILSRIAMETMVEQAKISVQNVMENYLTEIRNRMSNAQFFTYSMRNEETEGLHLLDEQDKDSYELAKINFYYKLNRTKSLVNGANGYFFYVEERDDLLTWDATDTGNISKKFLRERLQEGYEPGWSLYSLNEEPVLCLFIRLSEVTYGGWIRLEPILRNLRNDIQYQKAEFAIGEEPVQAEDEMTISLQLGKEDFYLTAYLDREEIVGRISGFYEMMNLTAMLLLLCIPLLYIAFSQLLLKPLRVVNHAQKSLQEGNLDYRISQKANSVEYEYSYQSFNAMAGRIQDLKIESYEKELDRQRIELKNLQLQIRPPLLLHNFISTGKTSGELKITSKIGEEPAFGRRASGRFSCR